MFIACCWAKFIFDHNAAMELVSCWVSTGVFEELDVDDCSEATFKPGEIEVAKIY